MSTRTGDEARLVGIRRARHVEDAGADGAVEPDREEHDREARDDDRRVEGDDRGGGRDPVAQAVLAGRRVDAEAMPMTAVMLVAPSTSSALTRMR